MAGYDELRSHFDQFHAELFQSSASLGKNVIRPYAHSSAGSAVAPTPGANIHATGIGLLHDDVSAKDLAYKVFVFPGAPQVATQQTWRQYSVEVIPLPWQRPQAAVANQGRSRPIVGGVSIAPFGANYTGTLGCFLLDSQTGDVLALSNNHVIAGTNLYASNTAVCQPGAEGSPTLNSDVFSVVATVIPLSFDMLSPNDVDAATARVTDQSVIQIGGGGQFGITNYAPKAIATLRPGSRVTKSGRTTGVTTGTVVSIVQNVQVDYGASAPQIATFRESLQIAGDNGAPFSLPGDSGSLVVDLNTGGPGALLFAGDGVNTFATDISVPCKLLRAWPI
jgi:hypothetical protein